MKDLFDIFLILMNIYEPFLQVNIDDSRGAFSIIFRSAEYFYDSFRNIEEYRSIEYYFSLKMEWKDKGLSFNFLKDDDARNTISDDQLEYIWHPKIQYLVVFEDDIRSVVSLDQTLFISSVFSSLDKRVFVKKESEAGLLLGDSLHPLESHGGSENSITMKTLYKANFICSFKELERYPFNAQFCFFNFFVSGTDNIVTDLRISESLTNNGPETVDQYVVLAWTMVEENVTQDSRGLNQVLLTEL